MPRWICPYCEQVTDVAPLIVGHVSACPGCQRESLVIDADAEQINKLRTEKALETANSQGLRSVFIATIVCGIVAAGLMFYCFFVMSRGEYGLYLGATWFIGLVVLASLASVFLEGVNEIHRCRKLLEELLRKRG